MSSHVDQPISCCHVVAVPYPGRGHINPMLNLCRELAQKKPEILVTFVVTEEWLGLLGSVDKPTNISFAAIPNVVPSEHVRGEDLLAFAKMVLTNMGKPFERLLDELRLPPPAFIIADAFLTWAASAANRRNIPMAFMWPMSASVYSVFYHFDLLIGNGHFPVDMRVKGEEIVDYIPGLPPIRVGDLPNILRDKDNSLIFKKVQPDESKAKYLIFTSVYELESNVIQALKQKSTFTIYNIGPAASYSKLKNVTKDDTSKDDYLLWLDLQPPESVLYISLGSFLSVSKSQMDEIAIGLNKSDVRFLWVARGEISILQEMCGEEGLVVEWCDQLRVLSHPSVGGFWTHCGWNSAQEAVMAGVPMLTFPIIMDQLPNAKVVVEDWRMGWRVKREYDEMDLATRDEIGEIVRRFMNLDSSERKELTRNARELQKMSEREFGNGGSFQTNLDGFLESILQHKPSAD